VSSADRTLEIVVPFAAPPIEIPTVREVKSALVTSSLQAIRQRGLNDAYFEHLDKSAHNAIRGLTASDWIPIDLAMTHYRALQSLVPDETTQIAIGREVADRIFRTVVGTLARLATSAGFTPWTGLAKCGALWDRAFRGGGVSVVRLGPKEAKLDAVKLPLLDIPYFRVAFRGALVANCELLSKRTAFVREVKHGPQSVTLRASWV
jgi:hypothetical protein